MEVVQPMFAQAYQRVPGIFYLDKALQEPRYHNIFKVLTSMNGVFRPIKDPYAMIFIPPEYEQYEVQMSDAIVSILIWLHQEDRILEVFEKYHTTLTSPVNLHDDQVEELLALTVQTDMITAFHEGLQEVAAKYDAYPVSWKHELLSEHVVGKLGSHERMQYIMNSILAYNGYRLPA